MDHLTGCPTTQPFMDHLVSNHPTVHGPSGVQPPTVHGPSGVQSPNRPWTFFSWSHLWDYDHIFFQTCLQCPSPPPPCALAVRRQRQAEASAILTIIASFPKVLTRHQIDSCWNRAHKFLDVFAGKKISVRQQILVSDLHLCFHICKKGGSLMTQLMDPAGLTPINLCTAYQPQTSTLACRKIHYTIQPANN